MWYFNWVLGVTMAVLLAIVNAVYGENDDLLSEPVSKKPGK